jgi:hypothetical protein
MNKIVKFSSPILINKGLIKKKVKYKSKIAKPKTFKDLIELWKGLIDLIRGKIQRIRILKS